MTNKTLADLVQLALSYVNPLIGLLFGALIVVYLWKIIQALSNADDSKKQAEELKAAGFRIFLVFLGLSFYAIAQLIYNSIF